MSDDERIAALKVALDEPTRAALERLEGARDEYKKLYQLLLEENAKLTRGLTGEQARKHSKNYAQLTLAVLEMLLGKQADSDDESATPETRSLDKGRARECTRSRSFVSGLHASSTNTGTLSSGRATTSGGHSSQRNASAARSTAPRFDQDFAAPPPTLLLAGSIRQHVRARAVRAVQTAGIRPKR